MSVDQLAHALLYEGYLLYPYRPTALKNQQRWSFGALQPPSQGDTRASEPSSLSCELLVRGDATTELCVELRFLQVLQRAEWQEANERRVTLPPSSPAPSSRRVPFVFEGGDDGDRRWQPLSGFIEMTTLALEDQLFKLQLAVHNTSAAMTMPSRMETQLGALVSAHVVVGVRGGELVSLLEPPPALAVLAADCRQQGVWPVLVGKPGQRDTMLCSPVVLYDYPRVAPESPGDLFDGGEIDEILSLRILTLTDAEKAELRRSDPRARALLERTESLQEAQLLALHGKMQRAQPEATQLRRGDRVRLRPRARGDVFDLALAGQAATVASIEEDYEGRVHVAVTVDADPGRDLGASGQPGHRFFFFVDEVEPL